MADEVAGKMAAVAVLADAATDFTAALAAKKPYYAKRIELFEGYAKREQERVEAARAQGEKISIVLPDGAVKEGIKGATTPLEVAEGISKSLTKKVVVAKVDGQPWDLFRPLQGDCALELCSFDDPDGKDTFWHSSSHLLGQTLELEFGVDLTIGPALEEGFYYDCYMGEKTLGEPERARITKAMEASAKAGHKFERIVVTRDEALAMFQENKFKIEIIGGLPADAVITVYRVGPMVDLCSGPHLPNTSLIKAAAVTNVSRAHWRADVTREPLQRIYGVTFPDPKQLKEYQHRIEEAKKRDHRLVGGQQELFFFHQLSPGSCFFLPHGARVYNSLMDFIKEKYWEFEYEEVVSPNVYNFDLWRTSGHADHYRENMFGFEVEKAEFGLKPMNCPGHCVMFGHRQRSYRELPMRYADFGVLHRNEFSGALSGLTRVRRFVQDDAHIFCRPDQVMAEVQGFLRMLNEVYHVFGLDYSMALSTRPEGYLGELELWDKVGGGRPGGVYDALRRKFQCATVQLDFQLPIRFNLSYLSESGPERPVIVHRAVLGSVERMFGILTEHFAGKWPLWLSPRQVVVVPISHHAYDYAEAVRSYLRKHARLYVDADLSNEKMQKKVRNGQLSQYNYILVVGEQEREAGTVNVRTRDNVVHGMFSLADVCEVLRHEKETRSLASSFEQFKSKRLGGGEEGAAAAGQQPANGCAE